MSGYPTYQELPRCCQNRLLNVQRILSIYLDGHEKPTRVLLRDEGLFLAEKIEVGVAADAGVNHGGEITREIVGVAAGEERKRKGELERDLIGAGKLSVVPGLAIDGDVMFRGNRVGEGFAVGGHGNTETDHSRDQGRTRLVGDRELVDSILWSAPYRKQILSARRGFESDSAVLC